MLIHGKKELSDSNGLRGQLMRWECVVHKRSMRWGKVMGVEGRVAFGHVSKQEASKRQWYVLGVCTCSAIH